MRYIIEGQIQRYLCRICGYCFSQSVVKVNIAGKVIEGLDSGENDHEVRVASGDTSKKEVNDCLPFMPSEDISSHDISIAERGLYDLPFYNSNNEVCTLPFLSRLLSLFPQSSRGEVASFDFSSFYSCISHFFLFWERTT